jgi:hypothetical protein
MERLTAMQVINQLKSINGECSFSDLLKKAIDALIKKR